MITSPPPPRVEGPRVASLPYPLAVAALDEAEQVWPTLAPLETTYPGFDTWFWTRVAPGLGRTRRIFRLGEAASPEALAIAKSEDGEAKLCTVLVSPVFRGSGHGRRLMEEAIRWLGCAKPLFTVPEERLAEFAPLLARFAFERTASVRSLYRVGAVEHVFNERAGSLRRP